MATSTWRRTRRVRRLAVTVLLCTGPLPVGQRTSRSEPNVRPAVAAIVDEVRRYSLVAIGEAHRNEQVHDFIVALLGNQAFLADGGDIVVEFGNARYQDLIDRYVAGETVARTDLVHVWRDTVNILVWDAPVYERLFDTIRQVNQRRSPVSRLRVLLADPPIDWSTIHDRTAWERVAATRDRHAADVIDRDVLERGRHGLLIFGSSHVQHEGAFDRYGKPKRVRSPNLAELLEAEHPGKTLFVLADASTTAFDNRMVGWHPPLLVRLKGTFVGDLHIGPPRMTPRLADLADYLLYLGPTRLMTTSTPAATTYEDPDYMRELLRRDEIQGGANTTELHRLMRGR